MKFIDKIKEKAGIKPSSRSKRKALQPMKDKQHKQVLKRLSDAKERKGKSMLETLSSVTRNSPGKVVKPLRRAKGYEVQDTSNPQSKVGGRLFIQGTNKLKSKLKK